MHLKYRAEVSTNYKKIQPLKIIYIENGIVHPLPNPNDLTNERCGGVTDINLKFVELSLTKRVSPPNFSCDYLDWYSGASKNFQLNEADYLDQDVVFLGALSSHYGHFITEGLARLWFFLDPQNIRYKGVYIVEHKNNKFIDLFKFFGMQDKNLIEVTKPTRFRSVIVPEQSIRLHDFYHSNYKRTIDKIKEKIIAAEYKKVYFSKSMSGNARGIGEFPIQHVFEKNGFNIFYPENMSMYETISVLKGCDEFVASSGTNIHNSIFIDDAKSVICLNRSAHFHPLQIMIDRMKSFRTTYIDIFLFSTANSFGNIPCYVFASTFLREYFEHVNFRYCRLYLFFISPFYFASFILHLIYKWIYSLHSNMTKSEIKLFRATAIFVRKIKLLF